MNKEITRIQPNRAPAPPPKNFLAALLLYGIASWFVMLAVGVIHAHFLPAVRAAGIGPCGALTALLFCVAMSMSVANDL